MSNFVCVEGTDYGASEFTLGSGGKFVKYEQIGKELGFRHVESGALVRSSYHAEKHIH